ncbi:hypothetical protein [Streptomyces thermoalcalitolerans]
MPRAPARRSEATTGAGCGGEQQGPQRYPGRNDPGFTLRTYTHLMPAGGSRTRTAVERVFTDEEPTMGGPDPDQEGVQPY